MMMYSNLTIFSAEEHADMLFWITFCLILFLNQNEALKLTKMIVVGGTFFWRSLSQPVNHCKC